MLILSLRMKGRMTRMSEARRVETEINWNGKRVDAILTGHLESVSYVDCAKDASDTIDITVENIDMNWMSGWYPKKGDKLDCMFNFTNWDYEGNDWEVDCGRFTLDDMSFIGGSKTMQISAVALPASNSFSVRKRVKTWKKITLRKIGKTISKRYGLKYKYNGPKITVATLEQDEESDMQFMYKICKKYGLGMKIYNEKLVIFDPGKMEQKAAVLAFTPQHFINGNWSFNDSLDGVYNGARINYKSGGEESSETKSVYFGKVKEKSKKARTLKVSETARSRADAKYIACAAINASNEDATTISGDVWPNEKLVAGVCIELQNFGKASGKYMIDKLTINTTAGGSTYSIEAHKCVKRLRRV